MDTIQNTFDVSAILGIVVPLIATYLLRQWRALRAWLADKNKWIVRGVYVSMVIAGFFLLGLLRQVTSGLPTDWSHFFWNGLVLGVAGTIFYMVSHNSPNTGQQENGTLGKA